MIVPNRSAGELNPDELERIVTIMQNPGQFKIPNWFVNRQKDIVDGKYGHLLSNQLDSKMREDLERLKKVRSPFLSKYCKELELLILRFWSLSRSATTEVSVPTGDSVSVVNTPRPLVVVVRPSVSGSQNSPFQIFLLVLC